MRGNLFTIGEIAKAMGMTVKALRFYERIGLIEPHFVDPKTKYRYYSNAQFMRLDIIKAARSMGMSMEELKGILHEKNGSVLLQSLARQGERVAEKIEELKRTAASIEAARKAIASSLSSMAERGVYIRTIPRRLIISRRIGASPSLEGAAVEYSALERAIAQRRLINTYETGILMAADEKARFHASEIFASVGIAANSDSSGLSALPGGDFLCVRYDEKSAVAQQAKLKAYLRRGRLKPTLMLQVDMLSDVLKVELAQVELQVLTSKT